MALELDFATARRIRMQSLLLNPLPSRHIPSDSQSILRTVKHLQALQGQDFGATRFALGIRHPGSTLSDIHQAFNDGSIVRSWPMRGTVHTVAAEDIGWIQRVTNHRVLKDVPKRRAYLGIPDGLVDRVAAVTEQALAGGKQLTREQLSNAWAESGLVLESQWRYHLVWFLAQTGLITMGPVVGNNHLIVLATEWIKNPLMLEGEEALGELASGFVRGRGPVTVADFAWWSGLTVAEAKKGFALAGVLEVRVNGVAHFVLNESVLAGIASEGIGPEASAPEAPEIPAAYATHETTEVPEQSRVHLLGAFDEHLLGYKIRDLVLSPDHFADIVPGRNGVFRATVVHDGEVVGVWRRNPLEFEALSGHEDRFAALDLTAATQRVADFYAQ